MAQSFLKVSIYLCSEVILLGKSNPFKRAAYLEVLFNEQPTYNELKSGTSSLEPYISLINLF